MIQKSRYIDRHHQIRGSNYTFVLLLFLLCASFITITSAHSVATAEGYKPLDIYVFMSKTEAMAAIGLWNEIGMKNTIRFYMLDSIWAIVWTSSLYYLYNFILKYRHALLSIRKAMATIILFTLSMDYLENISIVILSKNYPEFSDAFLYGSRGVTFLKWSGLMLFFAVLIVSGIASLKRK